jgi:hypothetical protein
MEERRGLALGTAKDLILGQIFKVQHLHRKQPAPQALSFIDWD